MLTKAESLIEARERSPWPLALGFALGPEATKPALVRMTDCISDMLPAP